MDLDACMRLDSGAVALKTVAFGVVAFLRVDTPRKVDQEVDVVAGMVPAHIIAVVTPRSYSLGIRSLI